MVRPELFSALARRPLAWLCLVIATAGGAGLLVGWRRGREALSFVGSCLLLYGLLGSAAAALYPVMLPSTVPTAPSLTADSAATSAYGLTTALMWWPLAFVLAVAYFVLAFARHREKVALR